MSIRRREFLKGAAAAQFLVPAAAQQPAQTPAQPPAQVPLATDVPDYKIVTSHKATGALGMPGLFPGRMVDVLDPASIDARSDRVNQDAVKRMMERGMAELTGEKDATAEIGRAHV